MIKTLTGAASAYHYPLLIKHLLHTPLAHSPNQKIYYKNESSYTYTTFNQRLHQLANGLDAHGITSGHTIAVMDWDSPRYLECFFAIPMMGAILHTVNVRLSPEQILYTINHAEDDVIIVNTEFLPLLEKIYAQIKKPPTIILINETQQNIQTDLPITDEYSTLVNNHQPDYEFEDFDENAIATTFYTTGTTGDPKGVYYSHRQLVLHTLAGIAGLSAIKAQGRFFSDDVYMPITPMFHVHAWGVPYVATLLGVKQVYPGRYDPALLLDLIQEHQITFSHCVPTILHMLLQQPKSNDIDLSRWKVVIGGSALPSALCKAALAKGIDIYTGYGMSETCPILTLALLKPEQLNDPDNQYPEIRCKTGLPIPMVNLDIADSDLNFLPHDGTTPGEIVVRAPWLTQGYLKNPEHSELLWEKGYLHTGDMGVIDETGYLQITDRIKDVIKTGGEWISSLQIEDILTAHPDISEAAVIGISDEKWGERPYAIIVMNAQTTISDDAVKSLINEKVQQGILSKWAIPDQIHIVDQIPKTSVGKIDKKLLRQQFGRA